MAFNMKCPYSEGNFLHFKGALGVQSCQIIRSFDGQEDIPFTNSCTVLVKLTGNLPSKLEKYRIAVIKCIDPRRSVFISQSYNIKDEIWTMENHGLTASPSMRDEFKAKFSQSLPLKDLDSEVVKAQITYGFLPPTPRYGDLLLLAMSKPSLMKSCLQEHIIDSLSSVEQILAVQEFCGMVCSHEETILRKMNQDPYRTFPYLLDRVEVTHATTTLDDSTAAQIPIYAPALVLEYVEGETLTQWVARRSEELDQIFHSDPAPRIRNKPLLQDVHDICNGCFRSNAVALLFGLQPDDIRSDNYQICRDPDSDKIKVRLIDAGGFRRVRIPQQVMKIHTSHREDTELQVPDAITHYYFGGYFFDNSADDDTTAMLQEIFMPFHGITESIGWEYLPSNLFAVMEQPLDTLFWRMIQIGLWSCADQTTLSKNIDSTIKVLRTTSNIMRTTMTEIDHGQIHWGWVALYRVLQAFCTEEPMRALSQLAQSLYHMLIALESDGIRDFANHFIKEPWCIYRILDEAPVFTLQPSQERRSDSSGGCFSASPGSPSASMSSHQPPVQEIHSVLGKIQGQRPSRLWNLENSSLTTHTTDPCHDDSRDLAAFSTEGELEGGDL